nr:FecR domain-containing protein [uncultured Carboxylicivirga sp.]
MEDKQLKILVRSFYSGTISRKEEEVLFEKVKTDKSFGKYFNNYDNEFLFEKKRDVTTDAYWKKFKAQYLHTTEKSMRKIIKPWIKFASLAAVVIVLLGVGQYFYFNSFNADTGTQWCEMIVPKGEKSQVILPDGTHIWLNSESKLRYPIRFGRKERRVILEGEAFFEVSKNKDVPFYVQTEDYETKVLGTEFNVMAYSDFGRTETTLKKGSVAIEIEKEGKRKEVVVLKPGQRVAYDKASKQFCVKKSNPDQVMAWRSNVFLFDNISFHELVLRLERWYDVSIELKDQELNELRYTGKFKNEETIWQVLDIIKMTTPIEYNLTNRNLTIVKKSEPM